MTVAEETEVTLAVGQQKELPAVPDPARRGTDRDMHAILEIGVRGPDVPEHAGAPVTGTGPALAEVLIVDTSRSMLHPAAKLHAAKDATVAAVRMLPDGTAFAVLSGRFDATLVHPGPGRPVLAVAGPAERQAAERSIRILDADGGTAIGSWLDLARWLLKDHPAPVKHVLLLTDGHNEHDHRAAMPLDNALDACDGRFVCDAWGIGDDWDAELLLRITKRLHGRARAVRAESELTTAYEELVAGLLGTAVPELRIRLTPTPGTVIRQVKQVVPSEQELLPVTAGSGGRGAEYVTRAWGDEVRHFQVVLTADPTGRETGEDLQLAAVEIVVPDFGRPVRLPPPQPVLVRWTDNPLDASRQHPGVRRHELYQQASAAVVRAYRAWLRGPDGNAMADRALAHALALAAELGDTQLLTALRQIEAAPGTARVRAGLKSVDWQHLILSSALTTASQQPSAAHPTPPTPTGTEASGAPGGGSTSGAGGGAAPAPPGHGRAAAGPESDSAAPSRGAGVPVRRGDGVSGSPGAGPGDGPGAGAGAGAGARAGAGVPSPPGVAGPPFPGRADGLVECPYCTWLGPADSVYCGGDCGRLLRGSA
ncbi:VWA domain-containing protein [Streptomyces actinomycinicus]|uniref:VWA domain-containing protein n=1 Tax=Streptomyces actinomycinicus TaxID=1695166 RepID=A0A937EL41_9ACTN|nr:VWA domain-containing protein [Streptomyces actinomycinicus]MBL1084050.1 VWA domain-containing protein [Streptomyces actinomycinicus]